MIEVYFSYAELKSVVLALEEENVDIRLANKLRSILEKFWDENYPNEKGNY